MWKITQETLSTKQPMRANYEATATYTTIYHSNWMYNTQAPPNEPNPELWLKQQEYYWICKLGTLTKFTQTN